MKMITGFTAVLLTTIGSIASAGTFTGDYTLTQTCTLSFKGESIVIPKGQLTISENIPVSTPFGGNHQAIIFQSNGATEPVLELGVGVVQPFVYGPQPFSVGAYANAGNEFLENYFFPKANGASTLLETIRLLSNSGSAVLIAVDESNQKTSNCVLGAKN